MSTSVDARGLPCPQPVVATKKALDEIREGVVTTFVDNAVAKENVVKFAAASGYGVYVEDHYGYFKIKITKSMKSDIGKGIEDHQKIVYLITKKSLGHGSDELGAILMKSFLFTLSESENLPKALMLINSGVQLAVNESPVLETLKLLSEQGVKILSCGTCLDYFEAKDRLAVGEVTNMYSILAEMEQATKAITL